MQEKNESVEESYEDRVFKVAEKVCARKKRGIPVDRWASTEEKKLFVEAFIILDHFVDYLSNELKNARSMEVKKGMESMSLGEKRPD